MDSSIKPNILNICRSNCESVDKDTYKVQWSVRNMYVLNIYECTHMYNMQVNWLGSYLWKLIYAKKKKKHEKLKKININNVISRDGV